MNSCIQSDCLKISHAGSVVMSTCDTGSHYCRHQGCLLTKHHGNISEIAERCEPVLLHSRWAGLALLVGYRPWTLFCAPASAVPASAATPGGCLGRAR